MINRDVGFSMHSGGKLNLGLLSKGNFSQKQQARAMEHHNIKISDGWSDAKSSYSYRQSDAKKL